ncbi:MAG TPA: L,D-transpeptidase family protein [Candidatus Ignatzschineria merdigallinarum]|uniref:L,D-transpeptidase family protein n=1 Tax=Candidatus Ignatzschineria merdigallinarum TaxID=2838621 RepID=A0A9D1Q358_9GAMM|nr:L,D-transpeptidase family protein [Candidatus Ignatzschineria merdigallinarum]
MKRNLIAVSLTFALMPALLQAAPSKAESVEIKIDLNNISSLESIFSGEVSTKELTTLQEKPPVVVEAPKDAGKELVKPQPKASQPITVRPSSRSTYVPKTAEQKQKEAEAILENFQVFTMPAEAIDYRQRATLWAEKAAAAGEPYQYQSRLSVKDRQNFKQNYLDKALNGEVAAIDLVTAKGLTPQGESLYQILLESEGEGLVPSLYHVGRIENLLLSGNISAHQVELTELLQDGGLAYIRDMVLGIPEIKRKDSEWLLDGRKIDVSQTFIDALQSPDLKVVMGNLAPQYPEYQNLKRALAAFKYREADLELAIVPDGATIKLGMGGGRIALLRDRLNYLGYQAGESHIYDAQMAEAVKAFQKTHLLEPDGAPGRKTIAELNRSNEERIKQIQINMERWRWMPATMGDHYVAVDIPGFRYSVVKDGEEVLNAKTIVGRGARRTPVFMSPMSYIVFSPYWHVPRSMAVKDFLPRLKRDPYALNRSKIKIFRGGQEIDPGSVDWSLYSSNNFPFQLRQDPGDYNSLGRVKFMFPNEHAIYLHDTPSKSLFNRTSRDFSSGCVRIENPEELAEYFLGEAGWDQNRISQAFTRTSEAHVSLAKDKKIPVYTLYMTTRVQDDSISFRADIYGKDKVLIEAFHQLQ